MTIRDLFRHRVFTISNFLTFSRILLLFPLWYLVINENYIHEYRIITLIIALTMISTDYFDGLLARKLGQESALGQYLDPVADKITILVGLYLMYLKRGYPLYMFLIIFIREIYGSFFGIFLLIKRDTLGKPSLWGKFGVFFIAISALWYLMDLPMKWLSDIPVVITQIGGLVAYSLRYARTIFYPDR
ncbi:MAG: CDP-alcohol phosphatidyltransferase family protein [Spirochaetia bacterium]|nr:CDP-alcohol phosphatidyltransferase family protein [Spirochaetia bacterium]